MDSKRVVILVGYGGVPSDCPPEPVRHFNPQEALPQGPPSPGLAAADAELRAGRAPTDPYGAGLRSLLAALKANCPAMRSSKPITSSAPDPGASAGGRHRPRHREVTVLSTMYTAAACTARRRSPRARAERLRHAGVVIRYVWPYSLEAVSGMLAQEVLRTEK